MPVYTEVFPVQVLQWLFNVTEFMLRPFVVCLNGVACPFIPTTKERQKPGLLLLQRIFIVPLYAVGLCLLMLPALVAFCFRNILHQFRKPYCISIGLRERPWLAQKESIAGGDTDLTNRSNNNSSLKYTVTSINVCLLPEYMSKYNNLSNANDRAKDIAERIVVDQLYYRGMMKQMRNGLLSQAYRLSTCSEQHIDAALVSHFAHLDFVCFQEVWDRDMSKYMIKEFHKVFPWIVHDVGYNNPKLNYCGFNSGLMIASRYEILDVSFKPYLSKCGFSIINSKGLLMIKVLLGSSTSPGTDNQQLVGYIFNTHLQAFQGRKPIVEQQFTDIVTWTEEFRRETHDDSHTVVFDVLCGDFNVDNMSPGDAALQKHELFSVYTDVCRKQPGQDWDWAVGTELRTPYLHDEEIATPDGLKRVMGDPYLRQQYLLDADVEVATMDFIYNSLPRTDSQGNIVLSPVGGKRRIDYVLYRNDCPVKVEQFQFVSRLAPLTDHIPVSMTFRPAL